MADFTLEVVSQDNLIITQTNNGPSLVVTQPPTVELLATAPGPQGPVGPVGSLGPTGPVGPAGMMGANGSPGQPRWSGHGPPSVIVGSSPGDAYLDVDSGTLYILE